MKSAIGRIDNRRINKLLSSAFFITATLAWLLAAAAHATPSHIPYVADDALSSDAPGFNLVQAQELETNLPSSVGEIISKVPDSLKLDLSIRVNRVFRLVFESNAGGNEESESLILLEKDQARKLADVPEVLIPASGKEIGEEAADNMGWSIFEGTGGPLIHRQMYRTDI